MEHPLSPKTRGQPQWLADQIEVSREMARKWLFGEAMPNQARMTVIADFFGVRPAWLRDGELPKRTDSGELDAKIANRVGERSVTAYGVTVSETGLLFAAEVEKLPPEQRAVVEDLVGVMVGKRKRDERGKTSIAPPKSALPPPKAPEQAPQPRARRQ